MSATEIERKKRRARQAAERRKRRYAEIETLPRIPCECGCGTMIAPISKKLVPARYAHGHNPTDGGFKPGNDGRVGRAALEAAGKGSGPGHANWRGGEWSVGGGYVRVTITPEQAALWPTARKHGNSFSLPRSHSVWNTAYPHDLVQPGEQVHHTNYVRDDDRIENLEKMDGKEHTRMHALLDPQPHGPGGSFTKR